ncbi:MAG: DUF1559 domain-containing protein [Planctomycetes bacterium]|nr:DUF1559 domain-containing protein [Planctomycetota bacterium]
MSREHAGPTTCPECGRTLATLFEEARDSDSSKIQTGFPAPLRDPRDYSDRPRRRRAYLQDKPVSEKGPNLWLWIGVPVGTVVIASTVIAYFVVQAALEPERKLEQHLELGIRRDEFRDNMKQIGKAMKAFHAAHGSLPSPGFSGDPAKPDSKPLLSWRVALLPYLNEKALFDEFHLDESWDSPHNAKLLLKIPAVYRPIKVDQATRHMTPIQLITGPDTVYPDAKTRPRVPESFPDGETETIIFVEAENLAPWTRPVDVVYDPKGPLPKFGTLGKDAPEARGFGGLGPCFIVGLGDGSIRFIYQSRVSERTIRSAINPNDGLPIGPDWK